MTKNPKQTENKQKIKKKNVRKPLMKYTLGTPMGLKTRAFNIWIQYETGKVTKVIYTNPPSRVNYINCYEICKQWCKPQAHAIFGGRKLCFFRLAFLRFLEPGHLFQNSGWPSSPDRSFINHKKSLYYSYNIYKWFLKCCFELVSCHSLYAVLNTTECSSLKEKYEQWCDLKTTKNWNM